MIQTIMVKVISYSLWGTNDTYCLGAIENAMMSKHIYPDWQCWFYCHTTVQPDIIEQLIAFDHVRIIRQTDNLGYFWRFYPNDEPDVDYFISRDTDSRLSLKEKAAVDEWLASGKSAHTMRDHPNHRRAFMGGMSGFRTKVFNIKPLILKWLETHNPGFNSDQQFLADVISKLVQNDIIVHSSQKFYRTDFKFPLVGSVDGGFVGARIILSNKGRTTL